MSVITTDTFLTALTKSSLLSQEQLDRVRKEESAADAAADARIIARHVVKEGLLTRWQAEQLLAGRSNLFLGKYKLLERIGKGGMGTVYKAEHTVMGRTVALKVMAQSLLNDAGAVARFHREVQAAASLQHPNIVAAYDADCVGKTHFLVMEYVEGQDLKERLQHSGRLPVGWVCDCIRQAALGLQHAHEHGMVHRDIKPANLLVTTDQAAGPPIVKILDMGLARFVSNTDEDGSLTKSGQLMGTPDYIAPEQAESTKHADIRADIFSLGCTMFHLLTGRTPYQGETLMAKLMARVQVTVPPVSSLRADVPDALDRVIAKMLETDPADRQQTPAEVAMALAPFTTGADAAYEDTVSVQIAAVKTPTVDMNESQPQADSGMNEFLDQLANVPDHRTQRVGRRAIKRRRSEPAKPEAALPASASGEPNVTESRARFSRWGILSGASAAIILVAAVAAFALRGNPTKTAETDAVETASSDSASESESGAGLEQFFDPPDDVSSAVADAKPSAEAAAAKVTESEADASNSSTPATSAADPLKEASADLAAKMVPAAGAVSAAETPAAGTPIASSPAAAHTPQTLVVGVGAGELPGLDEAFAQAGPGDTILIRHRGPLEFNPVDLNGKTPLTIAGDTATAGGDFWPILRQIPLQSNDNTQPKQALGLFHGDQLNLKLSKLHLAAAGPQRAALRAMFHFHSGRVALDECTVTVGVEGNPSEAPGPPLPLVQIAPSSSAPGVTQDDSPPLAVASESTADTIAGAGAEVVLKRSFLRGFRLQSCIDANTEQPLKLTATQTVWAGGPRPWLVIESQGVGLSVALTSCTIYNAPSLLQWKSYDEAAAPGGGAVEFDVQKSLFVGPYANKEPLMVWNRGNPDTGFERAAAAQRVSWQGSENVFHRYPSYYEASNSRKQPGLDDWRTLWKQAGTSMAYESDPMFRVWPDGNELQETTARDFQSRFWRKRRGAPIDDQQLGGDHLQMPDELVDIFGRRQPSPATAGVPRGVPRILLVNQKEGPYKTLEAAFADARADEIIEITDNGPYLPRRKFDTAPADGVLIAPPGHLTLRAREGTHPVVILRDDVQSGQIPKPHRANSEALVLLSTSLDSASLTVEGIHFRSAVLRPIRRTILCCAQGVMVRVNSCTFLDVGNPLENASGGHLGPDPANSALFLLTAEQRVIWLENNMFYPANRDACWSLHSNARSVRLGLVRNCGCEGTLGKFNDNGNQLNLTLRSSTLIGSICSYKFPAVVRAADNFVFSSTMLFPPEVAGALGKIRVEGENNCLWLGERRMTDEERVAGVASLIRGPVIDSVPRTEGPATPRDPHRRYRLRKGQAAASMAADGGPVGLRFEYLPDLSSLPTAFFDGL